MAKPRDRLTPRQLRFVLLYLASGNASASAIEAGYSRSNANKIGPELLGKPHIAAELARRRSRLAAKMELTAEAVLLGILRVANADPRRLFGPDGKLMEITALPDDVALAISGIDLVERRVSGQPGAVEYVRKIRFADRGRALEQLGRVLNLFRDGRSDGVPRLAGTDPEHQARQDARADIDVLDETERAQLAGILDKIETARAQRASAPLLEGTAEQPTSGEG